LIAGATKPEQLTENLGAINIAKRLSTADMEEINIILGIYLFSSCFFASVANNSSSDVTHLSALQEMPLTNTVVTAVLDSEPWRNSNRQQ